MDKKDARLEDAILEHTLRLNRVSADITRRVTKKLRALGRDWTKAAAMVERRRLFDRAMALAAESTQTVFGQLAELSNDSMRAIADIEQLFLTKELRKATTRQPEPLPIEVIERLSDRVLIEGSPVSGWWDKHGRDAQFRFAAAIRQGMDQGETIDQLLRRVTGGPMNTYPILEMSAKSARTLVQTSVAAASSHARREHYRANGGMIKGIRQVSTFDHRTTDICKGYSNAQWDLEGKPINGTTLPYKGGVPRHPNCRSVEVPITRTWRELGVDLDEMTPGMRASVDGPISSSVTFEEFLRGKTVAFQNDAFGVGKADLWRAGKITVQQLLDQQGNPLTLQQLRALYE